MKKKLAALLLGAAVAGSFVMQSFAEGTETTFVYGTTGYSEEMGDAGLNPHDNYSGWSCLRYGVGETLFKYNDNMEPEPWLATSYEFVDETTKNHIAGECILFQRASDGCTGSQRVPG